MTITITLEQSRAEELNLLQQKSKQSGVALCILELVSDLLERSKTKKPLFKPLENDSNFGFYRDLL